MSLTPSYHDFRKQVSKLFRNVAPTMLQALRDPSLSQLDVRWKGAHINAQSFARVRHVIESGQVLVRYVSDPALFRAAKTLHQYDTVITGVTNSSDLYDRSVFVHEAVHVRSDMRGKQKAQMPDEVLAYIVQATFLRFGGLQGNNYPGARDTKLLPASLAIADMLLTRNKPTPQQEAALELAIRSRPEYTDILKTVLHLDAVRPAHLHH